MTISIANKYFDYWSSKNLEGLDEIIHSDCILEDWQTKIYGKAEIKNFNEAFFKTNIINLKINNMIESIDEVWSYLTITINEEEVIEVVDILSFSEDQIISIKAFKG